MVKAVIEERFGENIARVKNLLSIYATHLAGSGGGRRSHSKTDVLRAATVMLHASLEDLLRSIAYWRLPLANAESLNKIPLATNGTATKFTLGQLASFRGQTVDDVITSSVNGYLERSNYNNTDEVSSLLSAVGIDVSRVNHLYPKLGTL